MLMSKEGSNDILQTFIAISTWQSLVAISSFAILTVGFWVFLRKVKLKFMYRVLIGLAIGLIFGITLQAIAGFPNGGLTSLIQSGSDSIYNGHFEKGKDEIIWFVQTEGGQRTQIIDGLFNGLSLKGGVDSLQFGIQDNVSTTFFDKDYTFQKPNTSYNLWAVETNVWVSLLKNVFMSGIILLTAPVVFIAIFRVTSKPGVKGMGRVTLKGVIILLSNVLFAFVVTFWMGYFLKAGHGINMNHEFSKEATQNKSIPDIITSYVPNNFMAAWVEGAIIPLMVLGALIGSSVKILSKRQPEAMEKFRGTMDRTWDVMISVLMTFMKIMPLAVMSMIASSLVDKPIGALASIGKVLGIGYLGIIVSLIYITFIMFISGVKVGKFWKYGSKVLLQGFATQSSNATLPMSMETLKNDMKISDKVVGTIPPLSTSMGLMACAGVQSGLITSFLWTANDVAVVHEMGLVAYFFVALIITLIASLGIAGVPGTAGVVTAGVLGGLGFGSFFAPVYSIVGALDGLFDMGRTGTNVFAGVQVSILVAKWEGEIMEDSPLLSEKQKLKQEKLREKILAKEQKHDQKIIDKKLQSDRKNIKDNPA